MSDKDHSGKLAARYAKALYQAVDAEMGREGSPTPAQGMAEKLLKSAEMWEENPEIAYAVLNPMFPYAERVNALKELLKVFELPQLLLHFVDVLFEKGRIGLLPEIVRAFSRIVDREASVVGVDIVVAKNVTAEERLRIETVLSSNIDGTPQFKWVEDPSILGGMIVSYGGKVLDGSLSGRLEQIERRMLDNSASYKR